MADRFGRNGREHSTLALTAEGFDVLWPKGEHCEGVALIVDELHLVGERRLIMDQHDGADSADFQAVFGKGPAGLDDVQFLDRPVSRLLRRPW